MKHELYLKKIDFSLLLLIITGACLIVFFIANLAFKTNFIGPTTDELGYLFTPARLAGWAWDEVSANFPYYSMGVGFLWTPFFLVFNDFSLIYKAIIILNGFFLALSFGIAFWCGRKIYPQIGTKLLAALCIAITIYPSNLFYSVDATSETLLYFLFWITFFLIIKICETNSWIYYIILGNVLGYMYIVHMRTMVIILATIGFLFCINLNEIKSLRKFFLLVIVVVAFYVVGQYFQEIHYSLLQGKTELNTINTDLDILGRIGSLFSKFKLVILGMIGSIVYFLVSCNICIVYSVKNIFLAAKECFFPWKINKDTNYKSKIFFFLFLVLCIELVAFATNKTTLVRLETIVYGRYMENVIGPFLLVGVASMIESTKSYLMKFRFIFAEAMIVGGWFVYFAMCQVESNIFDASSAVAVANFFDYYTNADKIPDYLTRMLLVVIVALLILVCCTDKKEKRKEIIIALFFFAYWAYLGISPLSEQFLMKETNYVRYGKAANIIKEYSDREVYYLPSKYTNEMYIDLKYLQCLLGKKEIHVSETLQMEEDELILLTDREYLFEDENCVLIERTDDYNIYIYK